MSDLVSDSAPVEVKPDAARKVAIVGEIPFAGCAVAKALLELGIVPRVLCPDAASEVALKTLPRSNEIEVVSGNLGTHDAVASALEGVYGVCFVSPITLSGRSYRAAEHVEDVKTVVKAAETHALRKVVYQSAVGANPSANSRALKDAAAAEKVIEDSRCEDFRIRTGHLMGRNDGFLTEIIKHARGGAPFMSIWGYGGLLVQPIYIGDFGRSMAQLFAPASDAVRNGVYAVVGPEVLSVLDLTDTALDMLHRFRIKFHVPYFVLQLQASVSGNAAFKEKLGLQFDAFAVEQNDAPKLMGANSKLMLAKDVQLQMLAAK